VNLAPDSFSSRRDTIAFLLCLLLAFAARLAPAPVQLTVSNAIVSSILTPFLYLQEQSEIVRASRIEYLTTVEDRDSILLRAQEVQALTEENVRLRALLGLRARLPVHHVPAEVLQQALPTAGLMARLSVGQDDGVQPGDPIVAPGGLYGVVQSATGDAAVALLWTHPDFRVSAMTADGTVFGIVAPSSSSEPNTALLELRGVPFQERLAIGAVVYTSGLGSPVSVYPRGVPIGTVVGVGVEEEGWSRTYLVRAAVHPASVSHVIVLTDPTVDVGTAFRAPEPQP
jgi:rod shape-determining protein MreC